MKAVALGSLELAIVEKGQQRLRLAYREPSRLVIVKASGSRWTAAFQKCRINCISPA